MFFPISYPRPSAVSICGPVVARSGKFCLAIVKCCSILFRKNKSPVFTWSNVCLPLFEGIELLQAVKILFSLQSISSRMSKVNYSFQFVSKWSHSCMFFPTGNISRRRHACWSESRTLSDLMPLV